MEGRADWVRNVKTIAIPNELRVLNHQIMDCEAKGFTYLAQALRDILNRQVRELGLAGEWTRFLAENETSSKPD